MKTEVKNALMTMRTERLVEIIGSLASECEVELHRGGDPADGTAQVFGSHANMGTFSLADIDIEDDAWRIDMDPKHEHLVRIEGCTDQVCDLLNEAVANEINAFEIISKPTGSGCGCAQKPPCIGCAKHTAVVHIAFNDTDDPSAFADDMVRDIRGLGIEAHLEDVISPTSETEPENESPLANKLNLYELYAIDGHTAETDRIFISAPSEYDAILLFHKARARDWENESCEIICDLIQSSEECDE